MRTGETKSVGQTAYEFLDLHTADSAGDYADYQLRQGNFGEAFSYGLGALALRADAVFTFVCPPKKGAQKAAVKVGTGLIRAGSKELGQRAAREGLQWYHLIGGFLNLFSRTGADSCLVTKNARALFGDKVVEGAAKSGFDPRTEGEPRPHPTGGNADSFARLDL